MAEALVRITAKTAAEVCGKYGPSDEARTLLKDAMAPQQFLAALEEKKLYVEALRFLAQALPKREAVFWAYACVKQVLGDKPAEPAAKALAAAHKWILDPSEPNRRATQPAYEAADIGTPAGCVAVAAFWSGGSLAPEGLPVVPPPDNLSGHGASCALLLLAVMKEPEKVQEKYAAYLAQGTAVASGKLKWS